MIASVISPTESSRREPAMLLQKSQAANEALRVRDAAAVQKQKEVAKATPEQTNAALKEINQTLQMAHIGVQFEFDKEAKIMIAKVVDVETGKVIRQMPSEEMIEVSKVLGKLQGLLVSQKV